jgi:tRNA pseudouridine55 synthase
MVSAVKVGGERLYRKARRGEEVERRPRPVTIYALRLLDFDGDTATLDVECSAGTYVRTLVHDLGTTLGSFAHLKSLRRTEAGGFTEDETTPLDAVTEQSLRPIADVVRVLRRVEVDPEVVADISHGKKLPRHPDVPDGESVALLHGGDLLGVYRARDDALVPDRVMAS